MIKDIAVSILGQEHKADLVNKLIAKNFTFIHYDVMDGNFVSNKSLPENELDFIFKNTDKHTINLHLMVFDPLKYIKKYINEVDYITFHYESESIDNIKKILKNYGYTKKLGIAINPKTNIEQIYEFLHDIDHVLIMSVVPGKGGQNFIESSLDKVKKLHHYIDSRNIKCNIQIDGGINFETGPASFKAGVVNAVSGSFALNNLYDKNLKNKLMKKKD